MNTDYTYCTGTLQEICETCKRKNPPNKPMLWYAEPMAKDNECINYDKI